METPGTLDPAPSTAQRPAERAGTGLLLFAGCVLIQAVLAIVPRLLAVLTRKALFAEDGGYDDLSWTEYLYPIFQGLVWLSVLGMVLGLFWYTSTFPRDKAALARAALILWGAQALLDTFYLIVHLAQVAGSKLDPDTWRVLWPILFWAGVAIEVAAIFCLIATFMGRQRDHGGPSLVRPLIATVAGATLLYGFNIVLYSGVIERPLQLDHPWVHFSLATAFSLAFASGIFFLSLAHARAVVLKPAVTSEAAAPASPAVEFPAGVSRGLATYRSALLWRLGVTVSGMILLVLAQLGRSLGAMKFFLVTTSLLSLACGVVMVAGMARFATTLPASTRARAPAGLALGVMIAGVLSDLAATALVFGIFSSRISTVMAAVKTAPWLSLGGQVLALVGMVALLVAFFRLGRALDMERIRERVGRIGWMLGFTIPLSVLVQLLLRFTRIGPALGLTLAGLTLVLAIITLVLFLGLLGRLILRLQNDDTSTA
ncbi:MAG: hypothetical protein GYA21_15295 [Myxococcales bacterium]|nr:hypothetical protein [Myxococcales bacterium]